MRKLPGMVAVDLGDRTSEQVAAEIAALWLEGRAPGSSRSGEATMI